MLPFLRKIPSTDISGGAISQARVRREIGLKSSPIVLIAEITSSIKLGTRRALSLAPSKESAPSLSTKTSSLSPKITKTNVNTNQYPKHTRHTFLLGVLFISLIKQLLPETALFRLDHL